MNAETWAKVRKEAAAFALTQLEGGFAHALSLAGDVFELGRLQLAIVGQDLLQRVQPATLVSIDTGGNLDVMKFNQPGGPEARVLELDWRTLTPQDGNPTKLIAWLYELNETITKIATAAGIPIDQRVGDLKAISQHLEDNEPEWFPDEDKDPDSEYWNWTSTKRMCDDKIALLGGAQ